MAEQTDKARRSSNGKNGKMHIVTNPNAGKDTSHAGIGYVIGKVLSSPKNPNRLYDTKTINDLEGVADQINEDSESGKIVAVGSGDGGVHQLITRVLKRQEAEGGEIPDFAIIPIGTMNMWATAIGANSILLPPKALAQLITDKLATGQEFKYCHCRTMKVNGEYCSMFGCGLIVHLLDNYYAGSGPSGGPRVIKTLAASLWREIHARISFGRKKEGLPEPVYAAIHLPDNEPPNAPLMTHSAIMASTIDQLGFGARVMPDALAIGQRSSRFLIRSTGLGYLQLAALVGQVWAGFPLPDTFDAPVRRAIIEFEKPARYTLDGEMMEATDCIEIEAGPLLRFIVG